MTFQMRSCSLAFNFNDCTNSFDIYISELVSITPGTCDLSKA